MKKRNLFLTVLLSVSFPLLAQQPNPPLQWGASHQPAAPGNNRPAHAPPLQWGAPSAPAVSAVVSVENFHTLFLSCRTEAASLSEAQKQAVLNLPDPYQAVLRSAGNEIPCPLLRDFFREPFAPKLIDVVLKGIASKERLLYLLGPITGRPGQVLATPDSPDSLLHGYTLSQIRRFNLTQLETIRTAIINDLKALCTNKSFSDLLKEPRSIEAAKALALIHLLSHIEKWKLTPEQIANSKIISANAAPYSTDEFSQTVLSLNHILHESRNNGNAALEARLSILSSTANEHAIPAGLRSELLRMPLPLTHHLIKDWAGLHEYNPTLSRRHLAEAKNLAPQDQAAFLARMSDIFKIHSAFSYYPVPKAEDLKAQNPGASDSQIAETQIRAIRRNEALARTMMQRLESNEPPLTNDAFRYLFDYDDFHASHFGESINDRWKRTHPNLDTEAFLNAPVSEEERNRILSALRQDLAIRFPVECRHAAGTNPSLCGSRSNLSSLMPQPNPLGNALSLLHPTHQQMTTQARRLTPTEIGEKIEKPDELLHAISDQNLDFTTEAIARGREWDLNPTDVRNALQDRISHIQNQIGQMHAQNEAHAPTGASREFRQRALANLNTERDRIANFLYSERCGFRAPDMPTGPIRMRRSVGILQQAHPMRAVRAVESTVEIEFTLPDILNADSSEITAEGLARDLERNHPERFRIAREYCNNNRRFLTRMTGAGGRERFRNILLASLSRTRLNPSQLSDVILYMVHHVNTVEDPAYYEHKEIVREIARKLYSREPLARDDFSDIQGPSETEFKFNVPGISEAQLAEWQRKLRSPSPNDHLTARMEIRLWMTQHPTETRLLHAVAARLPFSNPLAQAITRGAFPPHTYGLWNTQSFLDLVKRSPAQVCIELWKTNPTDSTEELINQIPEINARIERENSTPEPESADTIHNQTDAYLNTVLSNPNAGQRNQLLGRLPPLTRALKEGVRHNPTNGSQQRYYRWNRDLPNLQSAIRRDLDDVKEIASAVENGSSLDRLPGTLLNRLSPRLHNLLETAKHITDDKQRVGAIREALQRIHDHLEDTGLSDNQGLHSEARRLREACPERPAAPGAPAPTPLPTLSEQDAQRYNNFLNQCQDDTSRRWVPVPNPDGGHHHTYRAEEVPDRVWHGQLTNSQLSQIANLSPAGRDALDFIIRYNTRREYNSNVLSPSPEDGCFIFSREENIRRWGLNPLYGQQFTPYERNPHEPIRVAQMNKFEIARLLINPNPALLHAAIFSNAEMRAAYLEQLRSRMPSASEGIASVRNERLLEPSFVRRLVGEQTAAKTLFNVQLRNTLPGYRVESRLPPNVDLNSLTPEQITAFIREEEEHYWRNRMAPLTERVRVLEALPNRNELETRELTSLRTRVRRLETTENNRRRENSREFSRNPRQYLRQQLILALPAAYPELYSTAMNTALSDPELREENLSALRHEMQAEIPTPPTATFHSREEALREAWTRAREGAANVGRMGSTEDFLNDLHIPGVPYVGYQSILEHISSLTPTQQRTLRNIILSRLQRGIGNLPAGTIQSQLTALRAMSPENLSALEQNPAIAIFLNLLNVHHDLDHAPGPSCDAARFKRYSLIDSLTDLERENPATPAAPR